MSNQFSRLEIIVGQEKLAKLASSRIAVFGVGGVGGYAVETLARSGIGHIDLIDDDVVSYSNINRQITALLSTVGQYKVDVAKERIKQINENAIVKVYKVFYSPSTENLFDLSKYDYILDCIDTVKSKIDLIINAKKAKVKIISSMGAGNKINPTRVEIADIYDTDYCPLARVVRYELKKREVKDLKVAYSREEPMMRMTVDTGNTLGSSAFVPASFGLAIAAEVVKDIMND